MDLDYFMIMDYYMKGIGKMELGTVNILLENNLMLLLIKSVNGKIDIFLEELVKEI